MTSHDILIYQGPNGEIFLKNDNNHETVWANLNQVAQLFGIDRSVVTKYIRNILRDKEVDKESNVQNMHIAHSFMGKFLLHYEGLFV